MRAERTCHETRALQNATATPRKVYFSLVLDVNCDGKVPTSAKRKRSQIKLLST